MSTVGKRVLTVLGWAAMIDFLLVGLIGSLSVSSLGSRVAGAIFFGGLFFVWIQMGWRGAQSARERGWAAIAVVLLLLAVVGLTILVILWLS